MRNVGDITVPVSELGPRLGYEVEPKVWPLVLSRIAGGPVVWDRARGTLTYPEYVPIDRMIADVLDQIADGRITPLLCEACGEIVDMGADDGIFGDVENLEGYVCGTCADTLTARRFYEVHLRR
jgi:hypothetical protein